jgi:tRNA pseudouridine38-40 synthase
MCKEAQSLIGTHDFKGFMSSGSSVVDTVRTIYSIDITKNEDLIVIEVEGNGFLYNMVRIIVGTLVDIGRGRIKNNMSEIINSMSRSKTGHTAPAHGLFLKKVDY